MSAVFTYSTETIHCARRAVLKHLLSAETPIVETSDIITVAERKGITPTDTVSLILDQLKNEGLVRVTRHDTHPRYYHADRENETQKPRP